MDDQGFTRAARMGWVPGYAPHPTPDGKQNEHVGAFSIDALNALSSHIAVLDDNGRIHAINSAWQKFAEENGGNVEKLGPGSDYFDVCWRAIQQDDLAEALAALEGIKQVLAGQQERFELEYSCHAPDERRWFLMRANRMNPAGTMTIVSHIDITTRKLAEERLRERERELSALHTISRAGSSSISLDAVSAAIIEQIEATLSPDLILLFLKEGQDLKVQGVGPGDNPLHDGSGNDHRVGECLCGLAVSTREPVYSRNISCDDRCTWRECKQAGVTSFAAIPLINRGEVIGVLGIASLQERDFAARRDFLETMSSDIALGLANARLYEQARTYSGELENQLLENQRVEKILRRSQKREAIGTLAGGIAHDFNNMLAPILGYTELALCDLDKSHPSRESLEEVLTAANRAKALIGKILTYTRQAEGERVPIDLGQPVTEAIKLLRSTLPSTIDLVARIEEDLSPILGDTTQIHQLAMNLCTNAAQAMEDTGGTIDVSLQRVYRDSDSTMDNQVLPSGMFLKLTVEDTGEGMSPDVLESIFDPYYTTKTHGTGLGLAVVHGICKNHDAEINVYSEPGEGTSVTVYFPAVAAEVLQTVPKLAAVPTGTESILFVDDEIAVLNMGRRMLEKLGYKVTAITRSKEAWRVFADNPRRFDAVVSDMTMPELRGDQLAREILSIRPDLPIVLCTGFSRHLNSATRKDLRVHDVVMKPYTQRELATAVRLGIDAAAKTGEKTG